ncbi:MAG TPA: glycosyltransferase family 39 protein [Acidimicrobiales bacterium]|nr:glycosyltransferase family 39 protein [Acidimicrobiales bacterium]
MGAVEDTHAVPKASDVDVREHPGKDEGTPDDRAPSGRTLGALWNRLLSPANRTTVDRLGVLGVILLLAVLWGRGRGIWYWGDEGLAVGIASHPLGDIPTLLRQDGSPPLYYLLLHVWMSAFGSGEAATHTLSLLFALGSVGAAWWFGRSLLGRRVGWFLVALAALNPLLAHFANETRMYTLMVLLATLATGAFLHVFLFGRRRYLPLLVGSLVLLLYTHNWALFLSLGLAVALVPCLLASADRRRLAFDAVLGFGAAGLLFLPWVPALLFQRAHTAAPWAIRPTLELARTDISSLIGSPEALVAAGLGAGVGLATILRRRGGRPAVGVTAMAVLVVVAISVAWVVSRSSPVWAYRYLAVILPAILLIVAVGLASGGQLAVSALCVLVFLQAPIDVKVPPHRKSNVRAVADEVRDRLRPGDLVLSHFGELPVLAHYLPPGLRYASASGLVADERVADYRDSVERLEGSLPAETLPPLLDELAVGGHALLVCPLVTQDESEKTPFLLLLEERCEDMKRVFTEDPRFQLDVAITGALKQGVANKADDAFLYTRSA